MIQQFKNTYCQILSDHYLILILLVPFFIFQCQSDLKVNQQNSVDDWAKHFVENNEHINDYLASDFCEIAMAGFFNNKISSATQVLDSILFFSNVFTHEYNADDLSILATELRDKLEEYYMKYEIVGNDVSFFKLEDKLLILSVPLISKEPKMHLRSEECEYNSSYPFLFEMGCNETLISAEALSERFDNSNSNGCFIDEVFPTSDGPTEWNKVYLYRTIPNVHSNMGIYTSDCGDVTTCFARIEAASFTAINPIACFLEEEHDYCLPLEIPNMLNAYRLMIYNNNINICSPGIVMNNYQERLADLAKSIREQYLYGLNTQWTIHKALLRPRVDLENNLKAHEAVIQYVKWGYNPNIIHGK